MHGITIQLVYALVSKFKTYDIDFLYEQSSPEDSAADNADNFYEKKDVSCVNMEEEESIYQCNTSSNAEMLSNDRNISFIKDTTYDTDLKEILMDIRGNDKSNISVNANISEEQHQAIITSQQPPTQTQEVTLIN